jgi:hypothetical protein
MTIGENMLDKIDLFGEDMLFATFDEFYQMRTHIREKLSTATYDYKRVYRMYVHSRPFIPGKYIGFIWDYLNGYMDDPGLGREFRLYRESKEKKRK